MRWVRLLVGTTGVLAAFAPLLQSPAASQTSGSYTAIADARLYAVDFTTTPGVVFQQLVDAGVGVAQSQLDSLGQSTAFASSPYPSESVVLLPGLLAGFTGGQTSGVIPEYPLVASSSHPLSPTARVEAGSVVLSARSDADSSTGDSRDGANQAVAEVSFDAMTGTVLARSESSIGTQRISDALSLHGVRSFAEVRQGGDGQIARTSGFEVSALTILGQRVAVTPAALALAGEEIPLGLGEVTQASLAPLLEALAGTGTTVETFPAVEHDDGVTAGGLIVRNTSVPPPELASGVESVVTELRFGGNAVRVENRAFPPPLGDLPPAGSPMATGGQGSGGSAGAPPPPASSPASSPSIAGPTGTSSTAAPGPVTSPGSLLLAAADISVAAFYPVLIIAGCVILGIDILFRHLAVRTP